MFDRFREFILLHKLEAAIAIIVIYVILGSFGNLYITPLIDPVPTVIYIFVFVLSLSLLGAIILSILCLGSTIEEWGFTLEKKSFFSIGLGTAILLLAGGEYGVSLPAKYKLDFAYAVLGASAEEFYFRVLLISVLLKLFIQNKHKGWWAVIGSSIIFTFPHFFLPDWSIGVALSNAMVGGLILGFVFYKTRSNFFPIVTHVTFNTAKEGGMLGGLLFAVFYFILVLSKRAIIKHKNMKAISSIQAEEM